MIEQALQKCRSSGNEVAAFPQKIPVRAPLARSNGQASGVGGRLFPTRIGRPPLHHIAHRGGRFDLPHDPETEELGVGQIELRLGQLRVAHLPTLVAGLAQGHPEQIHLVIPRTAAGGTLTLVGSVDPNDKYALAGAGPEHWVQVGQVLPFEIVFENKTNAPAPAQEVLVTDDLDPRLDWSTFELKSLAFNDARITVPPGLQRFTTTTTVGTDTNEVVVDVSFNPATGRITWLMRSRDAATGELPEDPFAGFLPPNDASHRGEGSLSYVIRPKADLADGTRLINRATIIFDPTYGANPPIVTPMVTNAIDASLPTSAVLPLPAENDGTVEVQWTGGDAAGSSGIASFDLYVARDRGPYLLWQIATTETAATFTGEPGSIYHFYSVARDAAGNTEAAPESADAFTTVAGGYTYATWAAGQNLPANAKGPDDDADSDGLNNFAEYAHALNPLVADRALSVPQAAFVNVGGQDYLTLTYRRPKTEPTDVQYRVTASTVLTPWAGLATTPVGSPVDRGTYVEVTVRAPAPAGGAATGFLRLELVR